MKKLILFLSLFMAGWLLSHAAHVTQQQALNEATAFLSQKQGNVRGLKMAACAQRLNAAADEGYYYVFNIGEDGGFIIVSGDDRTVPILGYSDEGHFDAGKLPVNMKSWLQGYEDQMKILDAMGDAQAKTMLSAPRRARVVDTRNSIAPMLTTKWNQAAPYWNKCPEFMDIDENGDTIGDFAFTGCVAVSMAQVMKYHNWPQQTTKEIPSYTFNYNTGGYNWGTVEMESLPVTTFDWEHMKDSYNGSEDTVYTDAVSTLMYYVGCSVKSQYGVSSTGAYTDDIPKGFTEYFAYDPSTIQIRFRTDYTQDVWDDMVYQELADGRPLIYNGTAGNSGGHSFVCDGYEYGNYFHINWGWGGTGNGYFQLAVLNPRESGIGGASSTEGYNMKQNIIIGIQPGDPAGSSTPEPTVEDALTATGFALGFSGPLERDSKSQGFSIYKRKTFRLNYADHVGTQKKYDIGLALYDTDGGFVSMMINRGTYAAALTSALGSLEEFGSNIEARNAVKFGAGMTGTYRVVPMYQLQGTTEWKPMLESDRYYMECTMTNYDATFVVHPVLGLEIQGMEFEGGEKVGSQEQIHVTLKNNSVDRYFGDLYLQFGSQQMDEYSQYTTAIQAEVLPGETTTVTFNVTPANAGTQTIRLYYDANCSNAVTGSGSVTITEAQTSTMNMSVNILAENAVEGIIYDSHARFKVDVTNNGTSEYNKFVLAPLFIVTTDPETGKVSGSMITYSQSSLNLQPGETKTLYFDFNDLAYGSTYSLNIYARNENDELVNLVATGGSVLYEIRRGLVTWDGTSMTGTGVAASGVIVIPTNALAARLEGLDITSVTPNSNPNTLYFIGENETVPAGLENCNVVKGNVAQNVALKDGFGYFTPQSFTAQNISYERTFGQGRQAGKAANWSTIVLPFAPAAVTADGAAADWYRAEGETGKAMWVENFAQEVDDVVTFAPAQQMEANVPYIIAVDQASGLVGKAITWSAQNALLKAEPIAYTSGENYMMVGTFVQESQPEIYAVDGQGAQCVWNTGNQSVAPFRAYFKEIASMDQHAPILLPGEESDARLGDVNLDGLVDVTDVSLLIDIVLGKPVNQPLGITDINGDGMVDVTDVSLVIDIVLGKM